MDTQLIKRWLVLLMIPLLLGGCAGLVTPIMPIGPSTYRISGISAGSNSTMGSEVRTSDYLVSQALGLQPPTSEQILGGRRKLLNETGEVLMQKANEWCQKHGLVMIPQGPPHEDCDMPPPAMCNWNTWMTFVFKAVPAGH